MDVCLFRHGLERILTGSLKKIQSFSARHQVRLVHSKSQQEPLTAIYNTGPATTDTGTSNNSIINAFEHKLRDNIINKDDHQYKIVQALQNLDNQLRIYKPPESSVWNKLLGWNSNIIKPKGLYLWGSVGCGKTFLMDLFYENCSVANKHKQRVHFHRFMLDVHAEVHKIKLGKVASISGDQKNPIPAVAKSIVSKSWLLCLDEFQVTDVADAMILKQLFTHLFEYGVILLATSNRQPDDLYKSGLQRSAFLPFIPILKESCQVKCLDSNIDYRRIQSKIKKVYFVTTKREDDTAIDTLFKILALAENDIVGPKVFMVNNRSVRLNKTCGGIADCDFMELCAQPLGADDYDVMGKLFHTVIIRNIPQMTVKMKSEVRRFITFIDMMYDNRVKVVFSARVAPDELFNFDTSNEFGSDEDSNRNLIDDLGLKMSDGKGLSFITGEDEVFAFSRTISRIIEMQTNQYWESIDNLELNQPIGSSATSVQ